MKVFLSHSHSDKTFAKKLAADIRASGHDVWIDEAEIQIGDSLIDRIRDGLDEVDFVAAIISKASVESRWVQRELDIASNRELSEGRVVVLPLLLESVDLPGFLKGKFYADFVDAEKYDEQLALLLAKLGPGRDMPRLSKEEANSAQEEVESLRRLLAESQVLNEEHRRVALRGKSESLIRAINDENKRNPSHSPINSTYAFELASFPITLDYVLHAISSEFVQGAHPLATLVSIENKWNEIEAMLQAYSEMLGSRK